MRIKDLIEMLQEYDPLDTIQIEASVFHYHYSIDENNEPYILDEPMIEKKIFNNFYVKRNSDLGTIVICPINNYYISNSWFAHYL